MDCAWHMRQRHCFKGGWKRYQRSHAGDFAEVRKPGFQRLRRRTHATLGACRGERAQVDLDPAADGLTVRAADLSVGARTPK